MDINTSSLGASVDFMISNVDSTRAADLGLERLRWFWTLDIRLSFVRVMVGAPVWEYEFFNPLKISGFFEESFDYQLRETSLIGLFCPELGELWR